MNPVIRSTELRRWCRSRARLHGRPDRSVDAAAAAVADPPSDRRLPDVSRCGGTIFLPSPPSFSSSSPYFQRRKRAAPGTSTGRERAEHRCLGHGVGDSDGCTGELIGVITGTGGGSWSVCVWQVSGQSTSNSSSSSIAMVRRQLARGAPRAARRVVLEPPYLYTGQWMRFYISTASDHENFGENDRSFGKLRKPRESNGGEKCGSRSRHPAADSGRGAGNTRFSPRTTQHEMPCCGVAKAHNVWRICA